MASIKKSSVASESETSPPKKNKTQSSTDTELRDSLETLGVLPLAAAVLPESTIGSYNQFYLYTPLFGALLA